MILTPHFTLEELIFSETAQREGVGNNPPNELLPEIKKTAEMLEKIREVLGLPIFVTSGYRSILVNRLVGSKSDKSDHILGAAADIKVAGMTAYEVCKKIEPLVDELGIGQLIYEHTWTHVSRNMPKNPVNRILTLRDGGYVPGITLKP